MALYAIAADVLTNLETLFAGAGVDLPALRYVAPGPFSSVAPDCDQVVVTIEPVNRGEPGSPVGTYLRVGGYAVGVGIAIWRDCMPKGDGTRPPTAAAQDAAARVVLADLDLLWLNADTLLGSSHCKPSGLSTAELLPVQGGTGGSRLVTTLDLLRA